MPKKPRPKTSKPEKRKHRSLSPDDYRMTFGEHLEELRTRMIYALVGVVAMAVLCWVFKGPILGFLMRPVQVVLVNADQPPQMISLSPADPFIVALKLAGIFGVILSAPWVIYQAWQFVGVGLYEHERRFVKMFMPASVVLFYVGVFFMLWVVLPIVISFFVRFSTSNWQMGSLEPTWLERHVLGIGKSEATSGPASQPTPATLPLLTQTPEDAQPGAFWFNPDTNEWCVVTERGLFVTTFRKREGSAGVVNQYSIRDYVSMFLILALAFGIAFQMPIVVVFLAISGLVPVAAMAHARRFVYFGTVVLAAFLTPPDVVSQILLAVPMGFLFEAGLIAARFVTRPKEQGASET